MTKTTKSIKDKNSLRIDELTSIVKEQNRIVQDHIRVTMNDKRDTDMKLQTLAYQVEVAQRPKPSIMFPISRHLSLPNILRMSLVMAIMVGSVLMDRADEKFGFIWILFFAIVGTAFINFIAELEKNY